MNSPIHHLSRWLLCGMLVFAGAAKLLTPYDDAYLVPLPLYYAGAGLELAAAAALFTPLRRWALLATIGLAVTGITLAATVPDRLCGCFGSLATMNGSAHVLVSGVLGALACLALDRAEVRAVTP